MKSCMKRARQVAAAERFLVKKKWLLIIKGYHYIPTSPNAGIRNSAFQVQPKKTTTKNE